MFWFCFVKMGVVFFDYWYVLIFLDIRVFKMIELSYYIREVFFFFLILGCNYIFILKKKNFRIFGRGNVKFVLGL